PAEHRGHDGNFVLHRIARGPPLRGGRANSAHRSPHSRTPGIVMPPSESDTSPSPYSYPTPHAPTLPPETTPPALSTRPPPSPTPPPRPSAPSAPASRSSGPTETPGTPLVPSSPGPPAPSTHAATRSG